MAYAAVVSLQQILKPLLDNTDQFSPFLSLYEQLCSLQSSLKKIFPVPKRHRSTIDDLEIQVREAVYRAQDSIESDRSSVSVFLQELPEIIKGIDAVADKVERMASSIALSGEDHFVSAVRSAADFQIRIREAVYRAQDSVESDRASDPVFLQELPEIIEEIRDVADMAEKIAASVVGDRRIGDSSSANHHAAAANPPEFEIIGQKKLLEGLRYQLLRDKHELDVVPVVGMFGIGKTSLVRSLYEDPRVMSRFDVRVWVKVSQEYNLVDLFLALFNSMEIKAQNGDVFSNMDHDFAAESGLKNLALSFYQTLFDKRYLIVIDDIWDEDVWDEFNRYFPNRKNGSRIVLTTTIAPVAEYASTSDYNLRMPLLNDEESWILLQNVAVSAGQSLTYELKDLGKQIAKNCQGHPLVIIAVGKFLRDNITVAIWEEAAGNENPLDVIKEENSTISKSVYKSYHYLPPHLKACFLYMGAFLLKSEISVSKLVKLWVSEGFLEPKEGKSMEETAEECLAELASRSVVLLGDRSSRGRAKTSTFHLIYRNPCVRLAQDEKFYHVINKLLDSFPDGTSAHRRLCIHNNNVVGLKQVRSSMKSVSGARSLLFFGPKQHHFGLEVYLNFSLLKVLDGLKIRFYVFPDEVLALVQLRYLAITYDGELPGYISRLSKLQVLIVHPQHRIKWSLDAPFYLPMEIWKLHELRHLECVGFDLQDPSSSCDDSLILENLLTLSGVSSESCTRGVLERMPHVTKLGIQVDSRHDGDEAFDFFGDYTDLRLLESFKWIFVHPYPQSRVLFSSLDFSDSLRKITLSGCGFCWEDMTYIGRLPNLEVLKLHCRAFRGPEWATAEGEFSRLRFLLLEDLDLARWEVECDEHFPLLRSVIIRHCYRLEEIPSEFMHISTLDVIEVEDCSPRLVDSARKLQRTIGNPPLQVPVRSSYLQ